MAAAGDVDVVVPPIWRQNTQAKRDDNQRWSSAARVLKDAPLRGSVSRPGANHVHDRDTIFFFLSASRVGVVLSLSLSPFFFLRSFCPRKGPLPPVISPYLTRLIYASLLLYNLSLSTRVSSFNQIGPSAFLGGRFLTTEIKNHSDERSRLTLFIFEFCFEECMYMYMNTRIPLFHRLSLVVHFYKQSVGIADKLSNTNVRFLLKKTFLLLLLIATLGVEKINPPFVLVSPVLRMRENWSSDRGSRPLSREQAVPTATSMHREGAFVIHE